MVPRYDYAEGGRREAVLAKMRENKAALRFSRSAVRGMRRWSEAQAQKSHRCCPRSLVTTPEDTIGKASDIMPRDGHIDACFTTMLLPHPLRQKAQCAGLTRLFCCFTYGAVAQRGLRAFAGALRYAKSAIRSYARRCALVLALICPLRHLQLSFVRMPRWSPSCAILVGVMLAMLSARVPARHDVAAA